MHSSTLAAQVTVVVPVYNGAKYLALSLDSILDQTFSARECVVVDDGSTDDTAAVAEQYVSKDRRFRLIRQANLGTPTARNVGIAAASDDSEYLAFLDGDDTWLPHTLELLTAELTASPEFVGVYGLAEYMDSDGLAIRAGEHSTGQRDRRRMGHFDLTGLAPGEPYGFASLIVSGTMWPSAIALHRRSVVQAVGGFDRDLKQVQDWDLYIRMSRLGAFKPLDTQVAWYRQHDANVTKRSDNVAYYTQLVRWKAWRSPQNTRSQRATNRRVWRRLVARWLVRSGVATVRSLRARQLDDAKAQLLAAQMFAGGLVRGHPSEPDRSRTPLLAPYVVENRAVDRQTH